MTRTFDPAEAEALGSVLARSHDDDCQLEPVMDVERIDAISEYVERETAYVDPSPGRL
jgi:hypothetical protein